MLVKKIAHKLTPISEGNKSQFKIKDKTITIDQKTMMSRMLKEVQDIGLNSRD
jgi:hypothetical protein